VTDPAIIEAAARAVQREVYVLSNETAERIATAVLATVTPLIRAQVLEQALEIVESCALNADGDYIIERIRALQKKQP